MDFDNSVMFLLTALANKINSSASRRLRRRLDVGLMEWRVIVLLRVEQEATPARVAQVAGVDKSVVSRAVASLQQRGLLKVTSDSHPGRQTCLVLTSEGEALHDLGILDAQRSELELLHGFQPEERAAVVRTLQRLTGNLPRLVE